MMMKRKGKRREREMRDCLERAFGDDGDICSSWRAWRGCCGDADDHGGGGDAMIGFRFRVLSLSIFPLGLNMARWHWCCFCALG